MSKFSLPTNIEREYHQHEHLARQLIQDIIRELDRKLTQERIILGAPVDGRLKSIDSIFEKIRRKSIRLHSIFELDDLVGIRIIVLFKRDLERVSNIINNLLDVFEKEDVASRLSETQFGYQSQHYLAKVPQSWFALPSFSSTRKFKLELQIRTLSQHTWAIASHELQYKREQSIPPSVRRAIHRVSAMLETVDLEFERVLTEREDYLETQRSSANPNDKLNVDIIQTILNKLLPVQNRKRHEDYDFLLRDLNHFEIDTRSKLENLLQKQMTKILAEEHRLVQADFPDFDDDDEPDERPDFVYFTHTGLAREALREEFGQDIVMKWMLSQHTKSG